MSVLLLTFVLNSSQVHGRQSWDYDCSFFADSMVPNEHQSIDGTNRNYDVKRYNQSIALAN